MPAHKTLSRSQLSSLLNRTGKQSAVICGIFVMLATRGTQAAPTVSFNTPRAYIAGEVAVAVGDFNGDGIPDLAVVNGFSGPLPGGVVGVSVFLGNGDGSFQPRVTYALPGFANSVALGDFNHDGHIDLAIAGVKGVSVLLGNGDGTFQNAVQYSSGSYFSNAVAVGDFNGDGNPI